MNDVSCGQPPSKEGSKEAKISEEMMNFLIHGLFNTKVLLIRKKEKLFEA